MTDSRFEWPALLLEIEAVTRLNGRMHLRFHGIADGRERLDFGETEITEPASRLGKLGRTLDGWAAGSATERRGIETHLEGLGIELYQDLVPADLQKHGSGALGVLRGGVRRLAGDAVRVAERRPA
jgi:hypothetical protein